MKNYIEEKIEKLPESGGGDAYMSSGIFSFAISTVTFGQRKREAGGTAHGHGNDDDERKSHSKDS